MKIIVSHDVDHITTVEHATDLFIPKLLIRSVIEWHRSFISWSQLNNRYKTLLSNRLQNIEALMSFNKEHSIPATFFVGVENGAGLNYPLREAASWISRIGDEGFDVGVHGIAYDNYDDISKESARFKQLSRLRDFGIRMHYLRATSSTLPHLDQAGYLYDSSVYSLRDPYLVGNMWEIPLHLMDAFILMRDSRWQDQTLEQCKETTRRYLDVALKRNLRYFTILLHDYYFSDAFETIRQWYVWLADFLREQKFKFISYKAAIQELEFSKAFEPTEVTNAQH